jgi:hypothetical protein
LLVLLALALVLLAMLVLPQVLLASTALVLA